MNKGRLFLIPAVIAENTQQQVIPQRVCEVVKSLDYFLVENIRTARRYISSLSPELTIEELTFEVLDKKTSESKVSALMNPALKGRDIGVIPEAGCPGIADPGSLAAAFAHQNDIQVVPLVGPSSILLALMASGFNGQSFVFHGYLPINKPERQKRIRQMEANAYKILQTQMFMDTPYRNQSLFQELLKTCKPDTKLCVARDLTGKSEMIMTKTIGAWKSSPHPSLHKLPVIFALYF